MKNFFWLFALTGIVILSGCGDDDAPLPENEEEVIDMVILTFEPVAGGAAVTAQAIDPDGEGPEDIEVPEAITLAPNTAYILTIEMLNTQTEEEIHDEVKAEGDEHMIFFGFTDAIFISPTGSGNISSRDGNVDYQDQDSEGNPLGLSTAWTTEDEPASGTFRMVLKHQPDIKSETSTVEDGETDIDLTWNIAVE